MLKRLTGRLVVLSALVVILGAVSITPASSSERILICFEMPITAECQTGYMCCDTISGQCHCG